MYTTESYASVDKPEVVRDITSGEDMALYELMRAMSTLRDYDASVSQKLRGVEFCLKNINRLRALMEARYNEYSALEDCFTPDEAGETFLNIEDDNGTEVENA